MLRMLSDWKPPASASTTAVATMRSLLSGTAFFFRIISNLPLDMRTPYALP